MAAHVLGGSGVQRLVYRSERDRLDQRMGIGTLEQECPFVY
jgi:hypothetical protein